MYLLGANLTKFLATLTALMTVTAGLPSLQCRCPDGRIKHIFQGIAASGCCCAKSDVSSASGAASCCRSGCCAKKSSASKPQMAQKHSCCKHSEVTPQQTAGRDGAPIEVKSAGCEITLVVEEPINSIVAGGNSVDQLGDAHIVAEPDPVLTPFASRSAALQCPYRSLAAPPNLIISLCHFTC